jgi:hypothetical protein
VRRAARRFGGEQHCRQSVVEAPLRALTRKRRAPELALRFQRARAATLENTLAAVTPWQPPKQESLF